MLRNVLVTRLLNSRSFRIFGEDEVDNPYVPGYLLPSDVVGIILANIAKGSLAGKSFCLDFGFDSGTNRLHATWILMPLCQQPESRSGWAHLEELFLSIQYWRRKAQIGR
jgi:hypothetical protein